MNPKIDFSNIVPTTGIKGEDDEETQLLEEMFSNATEYLESFDWCGSIVESWYGMGVGGVVAVFLFRILPKSDDVDEWVWTIVGNLPPAYIVTDQAPNPACALQAYIREMEMWIAAVKAGRSVRDSIPVNAPPTLENAENLEGRIGFIRREILLPSNRDDLEACPPTTAADS